MTRLTLFDDEDESPRAREYAALSIHHPHHTVSANETEPAVVCKPRVVEQRPDEVVVEAQRDGLFLVTRYRHDGTTSCGFFYTRSELKQLVERARAVLETGQ